MNKDIQIEKITDILDKPDFYLSKIRKGESKKMYTELLSSVLAWLDSHKDDDHAMEKLAFIFTDEIYRYAASVEMVDEFTYIYYESIMKQILKTFNEIGIHIFYILDNALREDRFNLTIQLYQHSGFSTVVPYFDNIDQDMAQDVSDKSVKIVIDPPHQYEYCNYEIVETQIKKHLEAKRNIVYIEKDASVNYLDKVIEIAKNSGYLSVFRNLAPDESEIQIINSLHL